MTPEIKAILTTVLFVLAFIGFISICVAYPLVMGPIMFAVAGTILVYSVYKLFVLYFKTKE